jgi:hypothetical protein
MPHPLPVGQVVTSVGVAQATALGVEDGIEAGYEHVGRNVGRQRLVDPFEYFPRRAGVQGLGDCPQHAAGGGHHQRRWYALARGVSHNQSQSAVRKEVEVVEVAADFAGRLVVVGDLPALQYGHGLGERGLLDAPRHL